MRVKKESLEHKIEKLNTGTRILVKNALSDYVKNSTNYKTPSSTKTKKWYEDDSHLK